MNLEEAIKLLSYWSNKKEMWADLGCGSGTFTSALAHQLEGGGVIYAVDQNKNALNKIPDDYNDVQILKHQTDFTEIDLPNNLDGILMANSLHYVKDKYSFINNIKNYLKASGIIIIIEYDTDKSNHWVPFPISFQSLKSLFESCGFTWIKKLNEHPSIYRRANMYSAIIKKQ